MSTEAAPSSPVSHGWRARPKDAAAGARARWIKRIVLSAVLLLLAALLIWKLRPPPTAPVRFFSLPIESYGQLLSIPPIPFAGEDARQYEKLADVVPDSSAEDLWSEATRGGMGVLSRRLQKGLGSRQDALILYVIGQGVSNNGTAYLLLNNPIPRRGDDSAAPPSNDGNPSQRKGEGYEIDKILEKMAGCDARVKLLILDTVHLQSDPRLGMLVNEFSRLVDENVQALNDDRLWVLMADCPTQSSAVSYPVKQSVFGYYVAKGLAGGGKPSDGTVKLADFVEFVQAGVTNWAKQNGDQGVPVVRLFHCRQPVARAPDDRLVLLHLGRPKSKGKDAKDADAKEKEVDSKDKKVAGDKKTDAQPAQKTQETKTAQRGAEAPRKGMGSPRSEAEAR